MVHFFYCTLAGTGAAVVGVFAGSGRGSGVDTTVLVTSMPDGAAASVSSSHGAFQLFRLLSVVASAAWMSSNVAVVMTSAACCRGVSGAGCQAQQVEAWLAASAGSKWPAAGADQAHTCVATGSCSMLGTRIRAAVVLDWPSHGDTDAVALAVLAQVRAAVADAWRLRAPLGALLSRIVRCHQLLHRVKRAFRSLL
jgi:hypothetical protein